MTIDFADYEVRGCGARYVYRQVRWPGEVPRGWKHYTFIEGSLEVKLPTIWTDGNTEVRRNIEEKKKKEDQRRERVRGKKMQVREKVEKSRNTVFFQ